MIILMLTMIYDPINNLTCLYNTYNTMTKRGMVNVNLSIPFTNNGTILRTPIIDNVIKIITSNCVHNNILILITLIIKILNIKCSS